MSKVDEIKEQIQKLEAELQDAKAAESALIQQGFAAQLAVEIHNGTCGWNHTDGCSWYYEIKDGVHDWGAFAHDRALQRAKEIIQEFYTVGIHEEQIIMRLTKAVLVNR